MMKTLKSTVTASLASIALLALASGSAFAQEGTPFSRTDNAPVCSPTGGGTVCTFKFTAVPSAHRHDVVFAACSTNVLNPDVSRELVDLTVNDVGGSALKTFPLLPNLVTNSNLWIASQEVFVTAGASRHIEIRIQTFGGQIVGGGLGSTCSISGRDVAVP